MISLHKKYEQIQSSLSVLTACPPRHMALEFLLRTDLYICKHLFANRYMIKHGNIRAQAYKTNNNDYLVLCVYYKNSKLDLAPHKWADKLIAEHTNQKHS